VLHLLKTLERCDARRGMASLCIGGGQGGALLIERPAGAA
jgi:acetyl-CoA C-acetyltransferase